MAEKPPLGYKDFERLSKSIGAFKEEEGEDSLRRFESWTKNFFKFYVDLASANHKVEGKTRRSLLTKCLHEDIRLRLENSILPKDFSDFNSELMVKVKTFFKRKYNAIAERVRLHRRQQGEIESVQLYAESLKQIAAH